MHIWCSVKDAIIEVAANKFIIEWSIDDKIYRR